MTRSEAETRLQALPIAKYSIDTERWWRRHGTSEYEVTLCIYEEELSLIRNRFKGPSLANVVEQAEARFGNVEPDEAISDERVTA